MREQIEKQGRDVADLREGEMRFDHGFYCGDNWELCHYTGYDVSFAEDPEFYWGVYEDSQGELHFGN